MRNRKLINLKRSRNHEAKKDSKKRFKDIATNECLYDLAKSGFDRKKYRWSYYLFKTVKWSVRVIDLFLLFGLTLVFLVTIMSSFKKGELNIDSVILMIVNTAVVLIFIGFINVLTYQLKENFKYFWTNRCNQLLAILKHDGGSNWDKLSFNEQNILHEYISKECSRMQKIKLGKMTYDDFLAIKSNLDYLKSIDYVNEMPGVYGLNTRVQSFKGFYTTNNFQNISRGVNNARETKK